MEYSREYKEELKHDYEKLYDLYEEVIRKAGAGPYNEEEQLIIADYNDVCEEYEEVFHNKPHFKISFIEKLYKKRELPASKRKPSYCETYDSKQRLLNLEDYVKL